MVRPKEKALSDAQIAALKIKRLIFHVIDADAKDDEKVQELDEILLDVDQKNFFLERIRSVASGVQYNFIPHAVHTRTPCEQLIAEDERFVESSLELTHAFASHHRKNMASGVFVVAVVETTYAEGEPIKLVFLAKFDHRNVYQIIVKARLDGNGSQATMQKIANSLVEDKSAIQKTALISLDDERYDWHVLADERRLKGNGEITDYFREFLGVTLREVASVLTKRAVSTVTNWASALQDADIPDGEIRGNYRYRAAAYMETNANFDVETFLAAVIRNENDHERIAELQVSLREKLDENGLTNQRFPTRPNSLPKKDRKQVWRTNEGLILEFHGEARDLGIETRPRTDGIEGEEILIKTRGYSTI